ncbi:MAG: EAL domain-containing protein [Acidimicrobiales bacterium]|nr:EAL domain-containing protein [Acidimicrobiales bacterium]MCB9392473.1 EAL domain-containing protein [Acidimicrobiaceae bacterium]
MAVANGAGERSDGASRLDAHRLLDCVDDAILVLDPELRVIYANAATRDFLGPGSSEPTGLDPSQLVHTDDLDAAIGAFSTVVGRRTRCVARMRVRSGDDWRPVEVTFTDHCGDEHVGGVVLCFRNVTEEERYRESLRSQVELAQRNRLLHDQLRERQHFLSRLVRIQASISRRAPLHEVLDSIVDGAHQLLGDPVIGLELQHPDDPDTLTLVAGHGLHDRHVREHLLDRLGLGARAYATNRLAHSDECDDAHGHDAHGHDAHDASGRTGHCGIAVPIRRAGQAIGSLIVTTDRTDRVYSVAECEVLQSLADHAGLAIMDAQTVESMHEAFTDALTGLPNRRLLVDRLRQSLGRSHRQDRPLAVMFIDLDGFKAINDGRGHGAGDRVLGEVARRIGAEIRVHDTAARLGGDEFVVLLEDADRAVAEDVAERLLDSISADIDLGDRAYALSATIGVALCDGTHATPGVPEELLRRADIAMYSGKADGRNRVVFFEDWMGRAAEARAELEAELRRAVGDGSLQVAYQPVFHTSDGALHGFEALARWVSPSQGVVSPGEFIPLAARLGLAKRLDLCVLEQACAAIGSLGDAARYLELTVNLSPQHIDDVDLVDGVVDVLARTAMPANRLLLEITETDALRDPDGAVHRLQELRALGCRLAIDDFGTGYSSMTYLDRFPIDVVKIDRSFISTIDRSRRARRLTESVVDLAHSLGLEVVAEGVESAEQAEVVAHIGADLVQGFHYRRPGPESSLRALVDRHVAGQLDGDPMDQPTVNGADEPAPTSSR